jgi:hypothetical protein
MLKDALPEGASRVLALVERSAPDPDRPRLAEEWERQLADIDAKSAACYASMEDLSDRLDRVAAEIDDGVIVEDADEGDSLVVHVKEVEKNTQVAPTLAAMAAGNGSPKR